MFSAEQLFDRLPKTLKETYGKTGSGYRAALREEHFFPSGKEAEEYCILVLRRKPDDYNVYVVRMVVVITFRGFQRLVLAPSTKGAGNDERLSLLVAAHESRNEGVRYSLKERWEGRCGVFPM